MDTPDQVNSTPNTVDSSSVSDDNSTVEKVLSKEEISSLLKNGQKNLEERSGVNFLINSSHISHERLPMLEVIFDRLVRNLSTSLRNFTNTTVEVAVSDMTSVRFGDYLEHIKMPSLISIFRAVEWQTLSLLTLSPSLIYNTIDMLLGGRNEADTSHENVRPFTSIEQHLITGLVNLLLNDYSQAFSTVTNIKFVNERLESNPRFLSIMRPVDAVILVRINVSMDERKGDFEFCIPYASIEPVREQVMQMFMGEKSGQDNIWSQHLADEVWDAEVQLSAILGVTQLGLNDILNWRKGSFIKFRTRPLSTIPLCVDGIELLNGKMGKRDGVVSVKIENNQIKQR